WTGPCRPCVSVISWLCFCPASRSVLHYLEGLLVGRDYALRRYFARVARRHRPAFSPGARPDKTAAHDHPPPDVRYARGGSDSDEAAGVSTGQSLEREDRRSEGRPDVGGDRRQHRARRAAWFQSRYELRDCAAEPAARAGARAALSGGIRSGALPDPRRGTDRG